jgi:hypothetical protein
MTNGGFVFMGSLLELLWASTGTYVLWRLRCLLRDGRCALSSVFQPLKVLITVIFVLLCLFKAFVSEVWWLSDDPRLSLTIVSGVFVDGLLRPAGVGLTCVLFNTRLSDVVTRSLHFSRHPLIKRMGNSACATSNRLPSDARLSVVSDFDGMDKVRDASLFSPAEQGNSVSERGDASEQAAVSTDRVFISSGFTDITAEGPPPNLKCCALLAKYFLGSPLEESEATWYSWEVPAQWLVVTRTRYVVLFVVSCLIVYVVLAVWESDQSNALIDCRVNPAPESRACTSSVAPDHVLIVQASIVSVTTLITVSILLIGATIFGLRHLRHIGNAEMKTAFVGTYMVLVATLLGEWLCAWMMIFDAVRYSPAVCLFLVLFDVLDAALVIHIVRHLSLFKSSSGRVQRFLDRMEAVTLGRLSWFVAAKQGP